MGRPRNRVRFSRSGRMLDQVIVSATVGASMGKNFQNRVNLMEPRKDQGFAAVGTVEVEKSPDDVEKDITREDCLTLGLVGPEVGDAKFLLNIRIACSAVMPPI